MTGSRDSIHTKVCQRFRFRKSLTALSGRCSVYLRNWVWIPRTPHCTSSNYLMMWRGLGTLGSITIETAPSLRTYLFLLDLTVAYILKAKHLMKLLSLGISWSKCILSVRVYLSQPPMMRRALFWTTCIRVEFFLLIKAHAGVA